MKKDIEARIVQEAHYIIENNATIRQTAKEFGVSKSTIHRDISKMLEKINKVLYQEANQVIAVNKAERTKRMKIAFLKNHRKGNNNE